MTMQSEKAEWVRQKAEADLKLKQNLDDFQYQNKWGTISRSASENIHRIDNVLAVYPETDELEAENMRHYKAVESIMARYGKK